MAQEEEVLGKAYDSRLMRRLLTYLRPYRWQVAIAIVSIVLKSFCDVLGPYLTKVAIERYLAPSGGTTAGVWSWLSPRPLTGIAQIAAIYVGLLLSISGQVSRSKKFSIISTCLVDIAEL